MGACKHSDRTHLPFSRDPANRSAGSIAIKRFLLSCWLLLAVNAGAIMSPDAGAQANDILPKYDTVEIILEGDHAFVGDSEPLTTLHFSFPVHGEGLVWSGNAFSYEFETSAYNDHKRTVTISGVFSEDRRTLTEINYHSLEEGPSRYHWIPLNAEHRHEHLIHLANLRFTRENDGRYEYHAIGGIDASIKQIDWSDYQEEVAENGTIWFPSIDRRYASTVYNEHTKLQVVFTPGAPLLRGRIAYEEIMPSNDPDTVGMLRFPLPHMVIRAAVNETEYTTVSDADGNYRFYVNEADSETGFPMDIELHLEYRYRFDDKDYFTLYARLTSTVPTLTLPVHITQYDMEYDIDIARQIKEPTPWIRCNTPSLGPDSDPVADYLHITPVYHHLHEALQFALQHLNMGDELAGLPVAVGGSPGTMYTGFNGTSGKIFINSGDLHIESSNRPKNREYHEFGHHIMYIRYGGWSMGEFFRPDITLTSPPFTPAAPDVTHVASEWRFRDWNSGEDTVNLTDITVPASIQLYGGTGYNWTVRHLDSDGTWSDPITSTIYPAINRNHHGYLNPSTSDSFDEGFAIFMALLMSEYRPHPDPAPHIYAGFGSMEVRHKAWDKEGRAEEFAVCGILWSLYNDRYGISLNLDQIWDIIGVRRTNMYDYYLAFREAHPDKAENIDNIFIAHGFFADRHEGDGQYEQGEAYLNVNNNNQYYIDYGTPALLGRPWMIYEPGDEIGQAANYERPWRFSAGRHPREYLKVNDSEVRRYRVKAAFRNNPVDLRYEYQGEPGGPITIQELPPFEDYEYYTDLRGGRIGLVLPPRDADATITVEPASLDYVAGNVYVIDNREAHEKLYSSAEDHFDEHTFNLIATGTELDPPFRLIEGVAPAYFIAEREASPADPVPDQPCDVRVTVRPPNGGTVMGARIYDRGDTISLQAVPTPGWRFVNWSDDGIPLSGDTVYSFTAMEDQNLTAAFEFVGPDDDDDGDDDHDDVAGGGGGGCFLQALK